MLIDNLPAVIKRRSIVNILSLPVYRSREEDGLRYLILLYSIKRRFKTDIIKRRTYKY